MVHIKTDVEMILCMISTHGNSPIATTLLETVSINPTQASQLPDALGRRIEKEDFIDLAGSTW
jgi:hypothetical protein